MMYTLAFAVVRFAGDGQGTYRALYEIYKGGYQEAGGVFFPGEVVIRISQADKGISEESESNEPDDEIPEPLFLKSGNSDPQTQKIIEGLVIQPIIDATADFVRNLECTDEGKQDLEELQAKFLALAEEELMTELTSGKEPYISSRFKVIEIILDGDEFSEVRQVLDSLMIKYE